MFSALTVLYPLTLPELLDYILTTQSNTAPTLLVICSSRHAFVQDLSDSLQAEDLSDSLQADDDGQGPGGLALLVTPTLHNLFTTRHVKLAFCASVQALLAYLAAYGPSGTMHVGDYGGRARARMVLVNPLALHAPTPSFSAQGLSRTFAAAAETALKADAVLHVVECRGRRRAAEEDEEDDPWEQEVSILNVSARRFGSGAGEKAWAGRTIKAKRIAGRWFRFHRLGGHQLSERQI